MQRLEIYGWNRKHENIPKSQKQQHRKKRGKEEKREPEKKIRKGVASQNQIIRDRGKGIERESESNLMRGKDRHTHTEWISDAWTHGYSKDMPSIQQEHRFYT